MRMRWFLFALVACSTAQNFTADELERLENLHGSGTTNPQRYFWKVLGVLEERSRLPLHLTYRGVGSGTGQTEFVGKESEGFKIPYNDFSSGDIPMSKANYDKLKAKGIAMLHVPFIIGAVSFFYNIPGITSPLNVTACILAEIYTAKVKSWDSPKILELNPEMVGLKGNLTIMAARRLLGSSSTQLMSEYLKAQCSDTWTIGVGSGGFKADGSLANPLFPDSLAGLDGSDGMSNYVSATAFSIGYIESGHGHVLGMNEIRLSNKDGIMLTSKEADIAGAANNAVLPAPDADWSTVSLLNQAGPKAWPMTTFSYLYLRMDLTPLGSAGGVLRGLIDYILSPEGQTLAKDFQFEPVPQKVLDLNKQAMSMLQFAKDAPTWDFELPGTTRPIAGASLYTFSGKRRDTDPYQISLLENKVVAMEANMKAMSSAMTAISASLSGIQSANRDDQALVILSQQIREVKRKVDATSATSSVDDGHEHVSTRGAAIAGVVFGTIGFVIGSFAVALGLATQKEMRSYADREPKGGAAQL